MHATVVHVTINDEDPAIAALRDQVVPGVSQAPGFVTGYWTRKGNTGLSMVVWESEEAANAGANMAKQVAPESVTVDNVEVREVVASA
jgi:heme-degrading monooxygenase HmoA